MSLRNNIDLIVTKQQLIDLKNGKSKKIVLTYKQDNETISINLFKGD